jgi:hypothetical protein
MVFNDTFNNISVISWRSDLLVEEAGVPGMSTSNSVSIDQPMFSSPGQMPHSIFPSISFRHGRNRIVVGFTTTYAISAYHH